MLSIMFSSFSDELYAVWESIKRFLTGAGWKIVTALASLVIGIIVVRIVMGILRKILLKRGADNTLANFILTVTRFLLWLVLLFILAGILEIPLSPLVTALGAVALAVGLALKDSLSNLANGVMLIGMKPFKEGDFVEIDGMSGNVQSVGLLTTQLLTPDNKKVILPNSKITTASIVNYNVRPTRRVDWEFTVSYDSDVDEVKRVLQSVLNEHPKILSEPDTTVRLHRHDESALAFVVRAWVNTPDYWDVFWDVNENALKALKDAGIEIPYPQMDVHIDGACNNGKEDKQS